MFPQGVQYNPGQGQPTGNYSQSIPWGGHPMMWWADNNSGALWLFGLLWIVTWILFAAVLLALFRWLWKKGDKAGK
ncbi:hypothetical protein HYW39_01810 [Candidatus Curtissbacteria bacterium]|nr:hypothetical protein [Candidatus Curtissbacteria bacterium]MBI2594411.1 hypothetical protein [Candidatus Curtissbacteria bacterium]